MKLTYRPEIDGLRAIAVVSVILYHAQINILGHQLFRGGFIGVDIFFVISGYLITSIILNELITKGSFSFKYFYERRIRRILPVLLFIILVSLPFAWKYFYPTELTNFSKSILYSLGFSSNFYFHFSGIEYFEGGLRNAFLHTWSLSVEEQYYILFPLILLVTFKYFRKYLIHILIFLFVISLLLAEWSSRNYPSISFYYLHTRLWELIAGSILAYLNVKKSHTNKLQNLNLILPFLGLILVGHSILFFDDEMSHPSLYTLSPIVGVCLIIWFSHKDELITKLLSTKLFVGVGLISYSLYLWHYPIFVFVKKLQITQGNVVAKLSLGLIIIFISIFTYVFIEKPSRNKKKNFKIIILILFLKFLLIIGFCIYSINIKPHPILSKTKNDNIKFKLNYNFNDFNDRKNIFIVGNSYADNLLNVLSSNNKLNKKYYFYTALGDEKITAYDVGCFFNFLLDRQKINCKKRSFPFLSKAYTNADYIIFAEMLDYNYLNNKFPKIIEILQKDNKKILVFLDDLFGADILDKYIYRNQKLPNLKDLNHLEKSFFKKKTKYKSRLLVNEEILKKYDIKYINRSEIYCDHVNEKCPLLVDGQKLYVDYGHITNFGAMHFSNKSENIINKLIK